MPETLYSGEKPPSFLCMGGCVDLRASLENFENKKKSLAATRMRIPDRPTPSLVTIMRRLFGVR